MFSGKVVLITGATSGVGAATAVQFTELGATSLALVGRNLNKLEKITSNCLPKTASVLLLTGDLTNETECKAILDQTIEHFGKLDILVNGAEMFDMGTVESTSLVQYDEVMNRNVRAVYHLTLLAVPHLIKTKGNIVNVSSVSGIKAIEGVLGYSISKAAIDQFTRCTALDLAPKQVRVNSVNPEIIVMSQPRRRALREEQYDSFMDRSQEAYNVGEPGLPNEVAKSIVFLASDDASFITGVTMLIVGGRSINKYT